MQGKKKILEKGKRRKASKGEGERNATLCCKKELRKFHGFGERNNRKKETAKS
jgi:hypothetical protein